MTNQDKGIELRFTYLSEDVMIEGLLSDFYLAKKEEAEIGVQCVDVDAEERGVGVHYEFSIRWYDELGMRVEIFNDAFRAFSDFPEFWDRINQWNEEPPTPDQVAYVMRHEMDMSDRTDYPNEDPPYMD